MKKVLIACLMVILLSGITLAKQGENKAVKKQQQQKIEQKQAVQTQEKVMSKEKNQEKNRELVKDQEKNSNKKENTKEKELKNKEAKETPQGITNAAEKNQGKKKGLWDKWFSKE